MTVLISGSAKKAALFGAGLLLAAAVSGCQGTQTAPIAPTAQSTVASSNSQATGQLFGGMLPDELPQDPAAGFGAVEIIHGTTITLTAGRAGFTAGQAPDSPTPRARAQDGQVLPGQGGQFQGGQGGQFQGGQGQRGQGGQLPGGPAQGAFSSGSARVVSLEPGTKYFKGVIPVASDLSGAPGGNPPGAPPTGMPQPRGGTTDGAPTTPGAAPRDGGRGDRQFTTTVEPATAADVQVGSLVMVWGSVIDGRVYADVVYILPSGPGR